MIHPIFIRRLYSCTARARGFDTALPRDLRAHTSQEEMRKSGSPCTWDTDDTSKTCGKDLGLLCLASPSCQPRERSRVFPCPRALPSAIQLYRPAATPLKSPDTVSHRPREGRQQPEHQEKSRWKIWVPRFAFCFLSPSHDSPKLKLLWSGCSHFSMEGPQKPPGPQSPDPSTEELIPTLSSALEHSV